MKRLTVAEAPKTRAEFVQKYNSDNVFRSRAQAVGITVVMGNVLFPTGRVATPKMR